MLNNNNRSSTGQVNNFLPMVPKECMDRLSEMSGSTLKVYVVLLHFSNGKNECFPRIAKISEKSGVSRPQVFRSLLELEGMTLLEREQHPDFQVNKYKLVGVSEQKAKVDPYINDTTQYIIETGGSHIETGGSHDETTQSQYEMGGVSKRDGGGSHYETQNNRIENNTKRIRLDTGTGTSTSNSTVPHSTPLTPQRGDDKDCLKQISKPRKPPKVDEKIERINSYFDAFWKEIPHKENPAGCKKAIIARWRELSKEYDSPEQFMDIIRDGYIEKYKITADAHDSRKPGEKIKKYMQRIFMQHPMTYINSLEWRFSDDDTELPQTDWEVENQEYKDRQCAEEKARWDNIKKNDPEWYLYLTENIVPQHVKDDIERRKKIEEAMVPEDYNKLTPEEEAETWRLFKELQKDWPAELKEAWGLNAEAGA